jgi:Fe-S cluster biogenesis protein NfuA
VAQIPTCDPMYEIWILKTISRNKSGKVVDNIDHYTLELIWLGTCDGCGIKVASCKITKKKGIQYGQHEEFATSVTVYNESRTIRRHKKPYLQTVHNKTDSIEMAIYNNILQLRVEITGPNSPIYNIHINSRRGYCSSIITHKGQTIKKGSIPL